jgi:hypothetical protein
MSITTDNERVHRRLAVPVIGENRYAMQLTVDRKWLLLDGDDGNSDDGEPQDNDDDE